MAISFRRPPTRDDAQWRDAAACRNADPELFFPVGTTGDALEDTEAAIALCRRCPVREECLEYAMATNQRDGIWGARTEEDRRRMRSAWVAARRLREQAVGAPAPRTGDGATRRLRSTTAGEAR